MKNNIFSSLETNVSCNYKKDRLPQFEQITYHNHDGYEFYLFLKGKAEYYVEGVAKKLERGDFIIIKPYSFHFCNSNPDTAYERVFINIRESYLTSLNRYGINLEENLKRLKAGDLSLLKFSEKEISSFVRMANEIEVNLKKSIYGSEALVDSLLVQILIMINRKLLAQNQELDYISIMPAMIKETIDYINSHITEEISVQKLSGQIGYNPDYLCRKFKSITGFSLQHYIKARQISLAKKLLREGRSAYDVCFMTGFNNYSNFSRTFKNYENLSPKKYQMLQNENMYR